MILGNDFLIKVRPGKERLARHVTRENTRQTKNIERELSIATRVNKNAFFCFQYFSFLDARRVIQQPRTLHWMLIRRKGNRLKTCQHHYLTKNITLCLHLSVYSPLRMTRKASRPPMPRGEKTLLTNKVP